jgi:hypothetical protein
MLPRPHGREICMPSLAVVSITARNGRAWASRRITWPAELGTKVGNCYASLFTST